MSFSKPIQVYLDQMDLERLNDWARKRDWTKSQAIRAAVRALVRSDEDDPLLSASGMIDGLPADCSQAFDRYLRETCIAEKPVQEGKGARRNRPRIRR